MKYQNILALAIGFVAIAACQRESSLADLSRREIKFTATVAGTTKATATAFEEGDQIGLCIGSPVSIDNILLTAHGENLIPETTLYWPVEMAQMDSAEFIAFYPYEFSTYAYGGFNVKDTWIFGIAGDQYRAGEYTMQDYMSAVTYAHPSDASVGLTFKHLMSRFNLTIVDNLEHDSFRDVQEDSFQSITINQLYPWFRINFAQQTLFADPEGGDSYSCCPARMGTKSYSLLLPPQTVSPEIVVTLDSGKKMTYVSASPIHFVSGKQVSATLTLREDSMSLTYQIEAWEDDPTEVDFLQAAGAAIPNNQIWYTSTDGNVVTPTVSEGYGANLISNSYENGKGVITFDKAVTIIPVEAFDNCSTLATMTLPDSLATIQDAAFYNCSMLEIINIPESVTSLEPEAFTGCSSLRLFTGKFTSEDGKCLVVNNGVDNELLAFAPYGVDSYTVPDDVTAIGPVAFAKCANLVSIELPQGLTKIGHSAFIKCSSLTSIHIPETVATIDDGAFKQTSSLGSFTGKYAAANGRCLVIDTTIVAFAQAGLTSFEIPSGVARIEKEAFYNCSQLVSIVIPEGVLTIGTRAFDSCTGLTQMTVLCSTPPTAGSGFLNNTGNGPIYVPAASVQAYQNAANWSTVATRIQAIEGQPKNEIWYTSTDGNVVVLNQPQGFGATVVSNTYENGKGVITFDGVVTSVAGFAFNECSTLSTIALPDSLIVLGTAAFQNCNHLESIRIPDNVTLIGEAAFNNCYALGEVTLSNSLTTIEPSAFANCVELKTIDIPNSVTTLAYDAFLSCTGLKSFTGKFASDDNRYLVKDNEMITFAPSGLDSYFIPEGITRIGKSAFFGCSQLDTLVLPQGLTSIGEYAFTFCSSLQTLDIPNSVSSIGDNAFTHCNSLSNFTGKFATADGRCLIQDNTLIGFAKAGLTSFAIPDGVTAIGKGMFFSCFSLTSITIPASVTTIGADAFTNCTGLTQITVLNTTPPTAGSSFMNNTGNCPIYVPAASVQSYQNAANWSSVATRIQANPNE